MKRQLLLVLETTDTCKDTSHIVLGCLIDETKPFFSRADHQLAKGVSALDSSRHASPEPFRAIAGRRSCQDRPFPWTSPGCTFTKTKSLRRPGGSSCFQPTQRPVLCKAACPGAAVPAQSTACRQGVRRQACFYLPWQTQQARAGLEALSALAQVEELQLKKSLQTFINLTRRILPCHTKLTQRPKELQDSTWSAVCKHIYSAKAKLWSSSLISS